LQKVKTPKLAKKTVQAPKGYIRIEEYDALLQLLGQFKLLLEQQQLHIIALESDIAELKSRLNK